MSTFRKTIRHCAICGKEVKCLVINSTNAFGSPDLDLRPPPMQRSTMPFWIQKCPSCGYVAPDISVYEETEKEYLDSEEYIHCEGLPINGRKCERFYQYYLLGKKRQNRNEQLNGLLYAIWTCDDEGAKKLAAALRRKAIRVLESEPAGDVPVLERNLLLRADLLRRSGQYQKLLDEYQGVSFENETHRKIMQFQILHAQARDSCCYTVQQALDALP